MASSALEERQHRPYDIIVWGATGFTGQYVAEYLLENGPKHLHYALGGRSRSKLEKVCSELAERFPEASKLPLVVADSGDQASLDAMVQQGRVVISTVGPFIKYGTPLVDACSRLGTDYVDITGEYDWVKNMSRRYHEQAKQNRALIVSCCGFDSIPSDMGTYMLVKYIKQRYGKETGTVKGSMVKLKGGFSGGTIATAVEGLTNKPLPAPKPQENSTAAPKPSSASPKPAKTVTKPPSRRFPVYFDNDFGKWQGLFIMADTNTAVVRQSGRELEYGNHFNYGETMSYPSFWKSASAFLGLSMFYVLVQFSPTRSLLLKFLPAPGEGPSREDIAKGHFTHQLVAEAVTTDGERPLRAYATVIGHKDPGYGETVMYVAEAALCLALDRAKLSHQGGVLTPAAAMGDTLIDRYRQRGGVFEVTSDPFLPSKI